MQLVIIKPLVSKKRPQRITKLQHAELEQGWRERNQRLKEIQLPKETFEQYIEWVYGKGKKEKKKKSYRATCTTSIPVADSCISKEFISEIPITNSYSSHNATDVPKVVSATWTTGGEKTKHAPVYTGSKIIGIAVLHKSCLQPIFSKEEAVSVAHMRR